MKRLAVVRGGVAMALMLGIVVAVASSAEASPSGQLGAYMREGLSLERAQVALATQSQVEAVELPVRLEKALGVSFAGVWFEPGRGKFCIGVVSGASRRVAERVVAQAGLAGVVSYVSVRSTRTELIDTQGEWNAKLAHLGGGQFSTGLTPSDNAVFVTLSSSVPGRERALLEREAAGSRVKVLIAVVSPEVLEVRPRNSQCEFIREEAYCTKPIAAGVLITPLNTRKPTKHYCTAGPLAILANPATLAAELETFLITAGHCTEAANEWFTSTHPAPGVTEKIGSVVLSLWDLFGDYGDIEVGSNWLQAGVTPALAQVTNYQDNGLREARSVIGEAASTQGASVCRQGATSFEQCGTINAESILDFYSNHDVDSLVRTNSCGEPGDSGGPYTTLAEGNSVRILGTEVSGPEDVCGPGLFCSTCLSYYEPIRTSLTGLGLALLTTSNETRHQDSLPLFLNESKKALLFTAVGGEVILTASAGTIKCENNKGHGFVLDKSPLAHELHIEFSGKCEQKTSISKVTCVEPIKIKLAYGELGLLNGHVFLLVAPESGTEVVELNCGSILTKVSGAVIGEFPLNGTDGTKQYGVDRKDFLLHYKTNSTTKTIQEPEEIELLGKLMTGVTLKVEGFFGGKASQETASLILLDGNGLIDP
jgi:hypothetical protein